MKIKQIIQVLVVLFCVQLSAQKSDNKKQQATSSISIEKLLQQKSNAITITHQHTSSVSGIKHIYLRQAINGIGVYGTESSIHTDASGKTIVTHNNFKNKLSQVNFRTLGYFGRKKRKLFPTLILEYSQYDKADS